MSDVGHPTTVISRLKYVAYVHGANFLKFKNSVIDRNNMNKIAKSFVSILAVEAPLSWLVMEKEISNKESTSQTLGSEDIRYSTASRIASSDEGVGFILC